MCETPWCTHSVPQSASQCLGRTHSSSDSPDMGPHSPSRTPPLPHTAPRFFLTALVPASTPLDTAPHDASCKPSTQSAPQLLPCLLQQLPRGPHVAPRGFLVTDRVPQFLPTIPTLSPHHSRASSPSSTERLTVPVFLTIPPRFPHSYPSSSPHRSTVRHTYLLIILPTVSHTFSHNSSHSSTPSASSFSPVLPEAIAVPHASSPKLSPGSSHSSPQSSQLLMESPSSRRFTRSPISRHSPHTGSYAGYFRSPHNPLTESPRFRHRFTSSLPSTSHGSSQSHTHVPYSSFQPFTQLLTEKHTAPTRFLPRVLSSLRRRS